MVNLKENKLRKENEIFGIRNDKDVLDKKLKENIIKFENVDKEFNDVKKVRDEKEAFLTKNVRVENELKYKINMISNSLENNSSVPYAVKNVLDNPKLAGIHNVIGNLIETDNIYATAIGVALGAASNYIVTDDEFSAKEAINYLKINKYGRATFFPLNVIKSREIDNATYRLLKEDSSFIDVASMLVRYSSVYDNIIKNQLATTIVVKDLDSANYIARKINYKYRIVTLDGELLHIGGSLTGGTTKNNTNIISLKHDLEDSKKELLNITNIVQNTEEEINNIDDKYKTLFENRNSILEERAKIQSNIAFVVQREDSATSELEKIKEEINNINGVMNNTLSEEENRVVEEYYEKEKIRQGIENSVNNLKEELNGISEDINTKETEFKLNNSTYYKKTKELKDLEIKVNRADVKLDNLLNTLTEDYSMTFDKAKENYFLDMDVKEARNLVDKCKLEIKKLGEVNVGAIEEYERVSKRYEFLSGQKEDLLKAENTILEIIKELDEIMKEKFINSFNEISVKFKEVFRKLFGGGDAELKLTNPDDILTTGIDIKALPPGKKLQHISLLSGGEKTLTAISLLFAILEVRPVPFCILDEVEAALDEVNVDNFGKFLNEFKDKTQFIVITHKKKTMEYADMLYGITMQESGVSKLVSVKLEDIKEDEEK